MPITIPKYDTKDQELIQKYYGARGFEVNFSNWEVREPESGKLIGYHNGHEIKVDEHTTELVIRFVSIFDIKCVTVEVRI